MRYIYSFVKYLLSSLDYFLKWMSSSIESINHYITSHEDRCSHNENFCLEFFDTRGRMIDQTVRKSNFDADGNI